MILLLLLHIVRIDHGPYGVVAWIQPPHIAAGIGWVHGHFIHWWEVQ